MANVFNDVAKLWIATNDDILSHLDHTDANSGLRPVCIRMIRYQPATTGQGVSFKTVDPGGTPTVAISADTYTVTSTYRITDDSASNVFVGASAGDWVHIKVSSSGNNLGWYAITAVDGSTDYIDVAYLNNVLTNDTSAVYTMDIYTPESAVVLVSPTGDAGGASVESEVIDFGPNGRWFSNFGMYAIGGGTAYIYVK